MLVFQEVDHHHDWLSPMLAKEGYRSLFVKKPLAPGITFNPHLEDGCSLFYRVSAAAPPADGLIGGSPTVSSDERHRGGAAAATTLDLLDVHTFTLAVVEHGDPDPEERDAGGGDGGEGGEGSAEKKPAPRVAGNQVAAIALLSISSADAAAGGGGGESLVIVTTTHLKAVKDGHGEIIRARQVSTPRRKRPGRHEPEVGRSAARCCATRVAGLTCVVL